MGWAALIQLLLTILPLILKFLEGSNPATFTERQKTKLGQARAKCEEFASCCESKGLSAIAAPLASTSEDW